MIEVCLSFFHFAAIFSSSYIVPRKHRGGGNAYSYILVGLLFKRCGAILFCRREAVRYKRLIAFVISCCPLVVCPFPRNIENAEKHRNTSQNAENIDSIGNAETSTTSKNAFFTGNPEATRTPTRSFFSKALAFYGFLPRSSRLSKGQKAEHAEKT